VETDGLLALFLEAAGLKWMPRSGWLMRGVPHPESVADHSFGVAFVTLALAGCLAENAGGGPVPEPGRAVTLALLHDLGEARLTDLPAPARRLIPEGVKSHAESTALRAILAPLPGAERLASLWDEFEGASTAEGRLVRDADKLEMMVQCLRYERAGSRGLDEFWQTMDRHEWHYDVSRDLYARLRVLRGEIDRGSGG
jgi:putative hydrolase of HD superfamily